MPYLEDVFICPVCLAFSIGFKNIFNAVRFVLHASSQNLNELTDSQIL